MTKNERLSVWALILLLMWAAAMLVKLIFVNTVPDDSVLYDIPVWPLLLASLLLDRKARKTNPQQGTRKELLHD